MKTIATPDAIAAGVEEASKDAVAGCFVSIKKLSSLAGCFTVWAWRHCSARPRYCWPSFITLTSQNTLFEACWELHI